MPWKRLWIFLPLVVLVALPVALRPAAEAPTADARRLVIITPHNETITSEFARAFAAHYREQTGEQVVVDYRTPGGTSEIVRYVNAQFEVAFRDHWQALHGPDSWDAEVANAFDNRKVDPAGQEGTERQRQARREFLASDVGIKIDLLWGGGQYDLDRQAQMGHAVSAGMHQRHPQWFTAEVIPQSFTGETYYHPEGLYYGTCLAAFGIVYNEGLIELMQQRYPELEPPSRWEDLGDYRYFQRIAIADPTKSGSITKAFEMLIQQQIRQSVDRVPEGEQTDRAVASGWDDGLNLIKRLSANARYLTDSAGKIPRDVGKGDTVAGMCIDFYGRSEADFSGFQTGGEERVKYVTPELGSSISVDPILLFRGAPNRDVAIAFIEFVLSVEGQKLWDFRPGTPGGPTRYAIRRLPVRQDLYTPEHLQYFADPHELPYVKARDFHYNWRWTAVYFGLIRNLIRCMVLDSGPELRQAWAAIIDAGGPDAVPQAMEAFNSLPFDYADAGDANARISPGATIGEGDDAFTVTELSAMQTRRRWTQFFRRQYLRAADLAARGR